MPGLRGRVSAEQLDWEADVKTKAQSPECELEAPSSSAFISS